MALTATIAAVGAVSSIASANKQSGAIKKAGRGQAAASREATAEQRRQFDLSREDFSGTLERGDLAGESLAGFLGLRGQEAEQAAISGFTESPGQAFLRERQERSLLRNEAALGGLGGGNVRTALQEQAFGIASTQLGERKDRLAQVSALGTGAAGTVGQLGAQSATNIGNIAIGAGRDAAATTLARASARQSGIAAGFSGLAGVAKAFGS